MISRFATLAAASLLAAPVFAESHASGDAAAGETAFKQCISCHIVADDDGNVLAGRNAKTGPNLFGIVGATAGDVEGFRYGSSFKDAYDAGLVWDEANFVGYVMDPKEFLRTYLDDPKARAKMTFKVRKEEDALNLYAYLAQFDDD